jgi:hypothetical protein
MRLLRVRSTEETSAWNHTAITYNAVGIDGIPPRNQHIRP